MPTYTITSNVSDVTLSSGGAYGSPLTIADLPPPNLKRWVARRKAEVVAAVRGGLLSLDDACKRYNLTTDEFVSWQRQIERYGMPGLRATKVQNYRRHGPVR